jgi:large-conductance mechanosensitive channel
MLRNLDGFNLVFKERRCNGSCVRVAQDRIQWSTVVLEVLNFLVLPTEIWLMVLLAR